MSPVSVVSAAVVSGELVIGLSDGSMIQAGYVQGSTGLKGDRGGMGSTGQPGRDGLSVLSARGTPLSDLGKEGDFCIDVVSWKIYGPKSGASWGSGVMLRAPGAGTGPVGNDRELFGMAPQTLTGGVTSADVKVTAPIQNVGTTNHPNIWIAPATDTADGYMTKEDHQKLANIAPGSDVTSVFGRDGEVVAVNGDYEFNQIGDVNLTAPSEGESLVYKGGEWVNEIVTPPALVILGSTDITQPVPPTYNGQPYVPSNGDMWVNTTTGAADASWVGIGGETIAANVSVVYAPDDTWHVGGVIGILADYAPLSGADFSSDPASRGPRTDGQLRLHDGTGAVTLDLHPDGNIDSYGNKLNFAGTESNQLIRAYGNTTKSLQFQIGDGSAFQTYFEIKRLAAGDDSVTVYSVPLTLKSTGIGDSGISLSNNGQIKGALDATTGNIWTNGEVAITHPNDGSESVLAAYGGSGTNLHIKVGNATTSTSLVDLAEFTTSGSVFLKPLEVSRAMNSAQTGSIGFNIQGVRPGYAQPNYSILYAYYKTYTNQSATNAGDSIRYEGAIEDSRDLVNKGYVDGLSAGNTYTIEEVSGMNVASRNGELNINNSDPTLVTFISFAPAGDTGSPIHPIGNTDLIGLLVNDHVHVYQVTGGNFNALNVVHVKGTQPFAIGQKAESRIFPSNYIQKTGASGTQVIDSAIIVKGNNYIKDHGAAIGIINPDDNDLWWFVWHPDSGETNKPVKYVARKGSDHNFQCYDENNENVKVKAEFKHDEVALHGLVTNDLVADASSPDNQVVTKKYVDDTLGPVVGYDYAERDKENTFTKVNTFNDRTVMNSQLTLSSPTDSHRLYIKNKTGETNLTLFPNGSISSKSHINFTPTGKDTFAQRFSSYIRVDSPSGYESNDGDFGLYVDISRANTQHNRFIVGGRAGRERAFEVYDDGEGKARVHGTFTADNEVRANLFKQDGKNVATEEYVNQTMTGHALGMRFTYGGEVLGNMEAGEFVLSGNRVYISVENADGLEWAGGLTSQSSTSTTWSHCTIYKTTASGFQIDRMYQVEEFNIGGVYGTTRGLVLSKVYQKFGTGLPTEGDTYHISLGGFF